MSANKQNGGPTDQTGRGLTVGAVYYLEAAHGTVRQLKAGGHHALQNLNMCSGAHLCGEGAHDFGPGLIAAYAHHAGKGMCRLARHDVSPFRGPVEEGTKFCQVHDMRPCFVSHRLRDLRIHRACAGLYRITGMGGGAVCRVHRRGHAALRPSRGCALSQRFRRDHQHRARCQMQCGILRCKSRADDDNATRVDTLHAISRPIGVTYQSCALRRCAPCLPRQHPLRPPPALCAGSTALFPR